MKKLCKILSVGLSLAMCASLVAPALAVTYYIDQGDVYVESDSDGVYSYQGTKTDEGISRDKDIIITQDDNSKPTTHTITVGNGVTDTTITLSGVNIDVSGTGRWASYNDNDAGEAAFSISGGDSTVTVELDGENTLQSGYDRAGLELNDKASVIIQDNDANGTLEVTSNTQRGAAIGSKYQGTAGNITIDGGTVTAKTEQSNGAAIGSGEEGVVGNITINGGVVEASSETTWKGAGIGTGQKSTCGDITITGGEVTATGGENCAAIGTGVDSKCEAITITGGTVTAIGSENSAGIGSGYLSYGNKTSNVAEITISGGNVTAIGGVKGSGIGAGVQYGHSADESKSQVGNIGISNGNPDDPLVLLALSLEGKGAYTNNGNLTGTVLSCRLDSSVSLNENSTFAVLDTEGNVVREFSVYAAETGKVYRAFAIELPESDKGYVIAQKDKDGKIIGYLVDENDKMVYSAKSNEDGSVEAVERDGLKLGDAAPKYEFVSGTEGKGLPSEVTSLLDGGYKGDYGPVTVKDGQWIFQGWTYTGLTDGDGKLTVTYTGTWTFTAAEKRYEFVSGTEGKETLPGEVTSLLDGGYKGDYGPVTVEDGQWAFQGWANPVLTTVDGKLTMTYRGTWTFTAAEKRYEFVSGTEGKETLPEKVTSLLDGGYKGDYGPVTVEDGQWAFRGWMKSRPAIKDGKLTVTYTGTWTFTAAEERYEFVSGTEGKETLPGEVTSLLDEGYKGDYGPVTVEDGQWAFRGWTKSRPAIKDGKLTVTYTGTWTFTAAEEYYEFASGTEGQTLPENVTSLLDDGYADTYGNVEVEDGQWAFRGWTKSRPAIKDGKLTVTYTGTWTFTAAGTEDPEAPEVPDPAVEIDDVEVPLASGPVTRAEFIDYLWRQEGEPVADGVCTFADVAEDHEFALALAWAEEAGIAVADADGNFRPDDLLLRSTEDAEGELQEFLNRYAVYAGIGLEDGELFYELDGEPDGIIMGEEVLAIVEDFFAKLEAALAQKAA